MAIVLERVYGTTSPTTGYRVLVDRVWPRGVSRETLALDEWCREVAPSAALRAWFAHDPERWEGFRKKYLAELQAQEELLKRLRGIAARRRLVLLYGARDTEHNQAVVLRDALLAGTRGRSARR
ncbi:MAG TPA: DUF488 family protein [Planctomycetota bacterium]|jgi:uncharacterized protein YeaO (DUF488 family)|nr:DUF488 family protein [Planctomycetota bacterium]OQC21426.1 MAG: hypothetical protein BWX69_00912 [Planctomycetes bacterium ADurb.Bin069]NMD36668.1 DUF488 family protein [Planctomycetota bacterium]HNR97814.1 DUF488 family protein [Planctomycetota bacterium]HNU24719.1 DUF488 family protein [Planctomycetota bacterium]